MINTNLKMIHINHMLAYPASQFHFVQCYTYLGCTVNIHSTSPEVVLPDNMLLGLNVLLILLETPTGRSSCRAQINSMSPSLNVFLQVFLDS